MPQLRLGAGEGLSNVIKGQVHQIASAAQRKAGKSVHENVKGYDGDTLDKQLPHSIEKTV